MSQLFKAALLGILQGLTEFLPVSSTAHLLIGKRLLGFNDPGDAFTVMIQLGSILAVMWLYRAKIIDVVTGLPSRTEARRFALLVLAATVPALIAGGLLSGYVKSVLYQKPIIWGASFLLGGVVMLLVERLEGPSGIRSIDEIPPPTAVGIGVCQTLALVPGVSRSGATIVGGMAFGLERRTAAEFSFFLAMPTMAAAFAHDLLDVHSQLTADRGVEIAVGFVMAFIASALVVKPFLNFVGRSGFGPFAWYRIVAGLAIFAAVAAGLA